ncbi:MAG TPA: hypothetical protein VFE47_09035 [Tepidisphaeraceae bacterium]|nr:hypothetical protein [Tepidisphaeraceae bacterium]
MNTQKDAPHHFAKESAGTEKDPPVDETASAAFHDAAKRLAEIREYIGYYIAVQADAARLAVRNAIFYAALGILGLFAAAAAVVAAVVLFLIGIAQVIGAALGGRVWAGELIVGVVVLAALALGAKIASSSITGSSRRKTVQKYESLQRKQRTRFGQSVDDRAENP